MKTVPTNPYGRELPSFSDRLQSFLIDALAVLLLLFTVSLITGWYQQQTPTAIAFSYLGAWAFYESFLLASACTVGNYIKQIRVKDQRQPGNRLGFYRAAGRFLLKITLGWLSVLLYLCTRQQRPFHDLITGSMSIRKAPALQATLNWERELPVNVAPEQHRTAS